MQKIEQNNKETHLGYIADGDCCVWIKYKDGSFTPMFLNKKNLNETYILRNICMTYNLKVSDGYRLVVESSVSGGIEKDCFLRVEKIILK